LDEQGPKVRNEEEIKFWNVHGRMLLGGRVVKLANLVTAEMADWEMRGSQNLPISGI
jgi:hypothetical protein